MPGRMAYREAPEADPPEPVAEPKYRCEHCGATFDAQGAPRCPACLRKSAVMRIGEGVPVEKALDLGGVPGVPTWPESKTCPLCATRVIGDSEFYIRISKHGRRSDSITARGCAAPSAARDSSRSSASVGSARRSFSAASSPGRSR